MVYPSFWPSRFMLRGWDSNPGSQAYEAGELTTSPPRGIKLMLLF